MAAVLAEAEGGVMFFGVFVLTFETHVFLAAFAAVGVGFEGWSFADITGSPKRAFADAFTEEVRDAVEAGSSPAEGTTETAASLGELPAR